jgi:hypothetical protein
MTLKASDWVLAGQDFFVGTVRNGTNAVGALVQGADEDTPVDGMPLLDPVTLEVINGIWSDVPLAAIAIHPDSDIHRATIAIPTPPSLVPSQAGGRSQNFHLSVNTPWVGPSMPAFGLPPAGEIGHSIFIQPDITGWNATQTSLGGDAVNVFFAAALINGGAGTYIPKLKVIAYLRPPLLLPTRRINGPDAQKVTFATMTAAGPQLASRFPFWGRSKLSLYFDNRSGAGAVTVTVYGHRFTSTTPNDVLLHTSAGIAVASAAAFSMQNQFYDAISVYLTSGAGDNVVRIAAETADD